VSADFWMGVAATVGFFMVLNAGTAVLCLLFCHFDPDAEESP